MSENKFKKVMEILEKVIKINAIKGNKIVATVNENSLSVYDSNKGCEPVMRYDGYMTDIYLTEKWDSEFEKAVNYMNEALDKYLV